MRGTRGVNGPTGQRPQNRGAAVDPCLLAGSEDSGESKGIGVLASTTRTSLCLGLNPYRSLTRAATAMADGGEDPTVLWRSPAM